MNGSGTGISSWLYRYMSSYHIPTGGLPSQSSLLADRAVFTESYVVIPRSVMTDIVTSYLPAWSSTRLWVIARPLSGFATTFSQYLMEVAPGGGSDNPEPDASAQGVLFVVGGELSLSLCDSAGVESQHNLTSGSYVYLPPGAAWRLHNFADSPASFHWLRKRYQPVEGLETPKAFVTSDQAVVPVAMPGTDGVWATSRFVEPDDLRHDMHVNIVTFQPGGVIPFPETHVMEHGLFILEGKAVYRLNQDWVEVEAGDFLWLRAFCPQACYAGGPGRFRYLLYKDVNRHMPLSL